MFIAAIIPLLDCGVCHQLLTASCLWAVKLPNETPAQVDTMNRQLLAEITTILANEMGLPEENESFTKHVINSSSECITKKAFHVSAQAERRSK